MKEFRLAVFIGRFQPFHNSHLSFMKKGLEIADRVLFLIGSHKASATIKNPFSSDQRIEMIKASLSEDERPRVCFDTLRDYYYSDQTWISSVQCKVNNIESKNSYVALLGTYKDQSSYYLNMFPQWHKVTIRGNEVDATEIRNMMFNPLCGYDDYKNLVPDGTFNWIRDNFVPSVARDALIKEKQFIDTYKRNWSNVPYPVIFSTVDSVVIKSGHVLMIKRKNEPGRGLWALPGGFIKPHEFMQEACIRELYEETGLPIPNIESHLKSSKIFDHPHRSLRGRTITNAFYFDLGNGSLPAVAGHDDADAAKWISFLDLNENEDSVYEDHAHIIRYFVSSTEGAT